MPVNLKNLGQPMRSMNSPSRSYFRAPSTQTSTIFRTASVTSGQRGGLFSMKGMASLENMGSERALETFPPTQIEMPSFKASAMGRAGQTEKQFAQNMQSSSSISTDGYAIHLGRPNGSRGAGSHHVGDLAELVDLVMLDLRRPPVDTENGDVRTVHGPAHVEAAGQRDTQLPGDRSSCHRSTRGGRP